MGNLVVTIKVNGVQSVSAKLSGTVDRSRDLTPAMKQSAVLMMGSINANFGAGGRPMPWTPLSPSYAIRKARQGYSDTPLIKGGALRASITPKSSSNAFKLGTSIVYGRIHQKGGKAGRNHAASIPARPYLVFQEEDLRQINQVVLNHIKGA